MPSTSLEKKQAGVRTIWMAAIAGLVVATVVLLAIIRYVPTVYKMIASGGEDEPIVVAGGSMHIRAAGLFQQNSGNTDIADYQTTGGQVKEVDVFYYDDKGPAWARQYFSGEKVTVKFSYCEVPGKCGPATFETAKNGDNLKFHPLGKDTIFDNGHQISHEPETGYIESVAVGSQKPYQCKDANGTNGKCYVVIHYCTGGPCF